MAERGKKRQEEAGHGSGLSRTGFICINVIQEAYWADADLPLPSLPPLLCTLILLWISGAMNVKIFLKWRR
jgi:hypothetical protein